jgi:hypothetical protein
MSERYLGYRWRRKTRLEGIKEVFRLPLDQKN